ncbi:unnamed protein product [Closterium sp. NIES-54]
MVGGGGEREEGKNKEEDGWYYRWLQGPELSLDATSPPHRTTYPLPPRPPTCSTSTAPPFSPSLRPSPPFSSASPPTTSPFFPPTPTTCTCSRNCLPGIHLSGPPERARVMDAPGASRRAGTDSPSPMASTAAAAGAAADGRASAPTAAAPSKSPCLTGTAGAAVAAREEGSP